MCDFRSGSQKEHSVCATSFSNKKAPDDAGALSLPEIEWNSVAGGHWCPVTTEFVVEAQGDHVHVLADPVVEELSTEHCARESVVGSAHEEVVVFETGRPIRREAVLESEPQGAAPASRTCRDNANASDRGVDEGAVVRHRRAALQVQERRIPGVADLAGEQAYSIHPRAGRKGWIEDADARAPEIGPIALSFQAKHPLAGLPAVTDLAAENASGPIVATVGKGRAGQAERCSSNCGSRPSRRYRRCKNRSSRRSRPSEGVPCTSVREGQLRQQVLPLQRRQVC